MGWKTIAKESDMWNFENKRQLEGEYLSKETEQGPKKNSTIHKFHTKDGEVKFWGSTVLDNKLQAIEDEYGFGAKVRIEFLGLVKSKTGTQYKDFAVQAWEEEGAIKRDPEIPIIEQDKEIDLKNIPF